MAVKAKHPSDDEVKEFVDSKEALTQRELATYMYGNGHFTRKYVRFQRWWQYVLKTKSWKNLREYRDKKINAGNERKFFDKFMKLYKSDPRFKTAGKKRTLKLCKIYDFNISLSTIGRYLHEIDRAKEVQRVF